MTIPGNHLEDNEFMTPYHPKPIIVCAAVRYKDTIIIGPRHFDSVMNAHLRFMPKRHKPDFGSAWEQGFIDQFGQFHDREQAFNLVKANGQPLDLERNGGNGKELFSEGLY